MLRKATASERTAYAGLYALSHIVTVDGRPCPVEYLGEGEGGVNYEVMLPDGMHAVGYNVHSLCCHSLADVRDRAKGVTMEPCAPLCR